tara:strand:- start:1055 stop:1264 length:210 start_codon:yes stop_codon:yes gene_type:complete
MVYSSPDLYPIFWGLDVMDLLIFMELKKNNFLRSWLRETVISDVLDIYWSNNNGIIRQVDYFQANGQPV